MTKFPHAYWSTVITHVAAVALGFVLGASLHPCETVTVEDRSELIDSLLIRVGEADAALARQQAISSILERELDSASRSHRSKSPKKRTDDAQKALYGTLPHHIADTLLADPEPN